MVGGDRGDMQIKELVPGIIHQGVAPDISQHATSACIMRHSRNLICSGLRPDPISDPTTVAQNVLSASGCQNLNFLKPVF